MIAIKIIALLFVCAVYYLGVQLWLALDQDQQMGRVARWMLKAGVVLAAGASMCLAVWVMTA